MIEKGSSVRVNDDVFTNGSTLAANNGMVLKAAYNKEDPKVGKSGTNQAFSTANGGEIYLTEEQYTVEK